MWLKQSSERGAHPGTCCKEKAQQYHPEHHQNSTLASPSKPVSWAPEKGIDILATRLGPAQTHTAQPLLQKEHTLAKRRLSCTYNTAKLKNCCISQAALKFHRLILFQCRNVTVSFLHTGWQSKELCNCPQGSAWMSLGTKIPSQQAGHGCRTNLLLPCHQGGYKRCSVPLAL